MKNSMILVAIALLACAGFAQEQTGNPIEEGAKAVVKTVAGGYQALDIVSGEGLTGVMSYQIDDMLWQMGPDGLWREMTRFNEVADGWSMGADARLRYQYHSPKTMSKTEDPHEDMYGRFRTRFWTRFSPTDNIDFNFRITGEPRYYCHPDKSPRQYTHDEWLIDRLNMTWRNAFDMPMTVVIGRQDIALGSGWLISNGTPGDGSRTSFFDALRFTYSMDDSTTVDLIGISNYANSSKYLGVINDKGIDLANQNEWGMIAYLSKKLTPQTRMDGYFIYVNERNDRFTSGDEGETFTLGALYSKKMDENWSYVLEVAPQFGHRNGKNICAFGTNNTMTYALNDAKANQFYAGWQYLSGEDDPEQAFSRPWGRAGYSIANIYNGSIDAIDGQGDDNSNLHDFSIGWIQKPTEKTQFHTSYHFLLADQNTQDGGTNGLSESGCTRGHAITAELRHTFSEHVAHRVNAEMFIPGDYYNKDRNDVVTFARYEVVLSW